MAGDRDHVEYCIEKRRFQKLVTKPFINYIGEESRLCRSCFRVAEKVIRDIYNQTKKRRRYEILNKKAVEKWNNDMNSGVFQKFMEEEKLEKRSFCIFLLVTISLARNRWIVYGN